MATMKRSGYDAWHDVGLSSTAGELACSSDGQRSPWRRRRHARTASQRCQEPAGGGGAPHMPARRRNPDILASPACASVLTSATSRLTALVQGRNKARAAQLEPGTRVTGK